MKIFVLGGTSMPGWSLFRNRGARDAVFFCSPHVKAEACADWPRLRLEDADAYRQLFKDGAPDLLIHCGGVCDIDKCEEDPAWAKRINVDGTARLLDVLPGRTRLLYLSSDHVFGGREAPYDEDSAPEPISEYGRSRVAAERLVAARVGETLIVRYALGIGPSYNGRNGHLNWLQHRSAKGLPLTVYRDEYRSAVWADDLAERLYALGESPVTGLRHVTATRTVSRAELAQAVDRRFGVGAQFTLRSRDEAPVPHLGRIQLASVFRDEWAAPLASPAD